MRKRHTFAAAAVLLGGLTLAGCGGKDEAKSPAEKPGGAAAASAAAPTAGPRLRPGLWRVVSSGDGPVGESRMCLDEAVQARLNVIGSQASPGSCQATETRPRPGGGWTFRTGCDMTALGGGHSVSEGEITGDLTTAYSSRSTVVTTGADVAHMNNTVTIASDGTYEGPCPAGMKPGDIEIPGGVKFNMVEMADMAARARPTAPAPAP